MSWNFEENKAFENALAELGLDYPNLLQEVASRIPNKTIEQIKLHYDALVSDVERIELGHFDEETLLIYDGSPTSSQDEPNPSNVPFPRVHKKRGVRWTNEEHEAFMVGMEKYGRGDWRSISRYHVPSKTPKQVGSHAQKYFEKLERHAKKEAQAQAQAQAQILANATINNAPANDRTTS